MEQEQRKLKKNGVYRTIAVIYAILALAFTVMLLWLNVLPAKILYPVVALLIVISLFIVPVMYSKRGKSGRYGRFFVRSSVRVQIWSRREGEWLTTRRPMFRAAVSARRKFQICAWVIRSSMVLISSARRN